jgi:hypothetical protein
MEKTLEERIALRKSRQSEAHRRWRMSDKGKAYYAKRKQKVNETA